MFDPKVMIIELVNHSKHFIIETVLLFLIHVNFELIQRNLKIQTVNPNSLKYINS